MRLYLIRAVPFFLFLLTSCSETVPPTDVDSRVVAHVGQIDLTVSWFDQTYVNFLIQSGRNDTIENRYAHLENLIDAILLSGEAEGFGLTETPGYKRFRERKHLQLLAARYFEWAFLRQLPAPTDAEVRQAFVRWNTQAVVRHLFYANKTEADAAYKRLRLGGNFLEEARRTYGLSEIDSSAGYLGPIRYYNVDDAFAEAAFELSPGAYSEPIRSRFGYHIIRLEDMIRNPLLTESDYQTRRAGIESKFRLRRRRIEGDRFVRTFMEAKNVIVAPQAIAALQSMLKDFAIDVNRRPTIQTARQEGFEMDSLRLNLNPSTILATYTDRRKNREFTAGDYVLWLDALPFQEALNRTAASVGRAMRNQLLADAALERGLDDRKVFDLLERDLLEERSRRVVRFLKDQEYTDVDSTLLEGVFDGKGLGSQQFFTTDFEQIPFETFREAELARNRLSPSFEDAPREPGYAKIIDAETDDYPELSPYFRSLEIGDPAVVGVKEQWLLIRIDKRTKQELSWAADRETIVARLRPFVAQYQLVRQLRNSTSISRDTLLFRQMSEQ